MKKALITGITGQDGSYLAELLISKGYEVHGVIRRVAVDSQAKRFSRISDLVGQKATFHSGTVENFQSMFNIINEIKPDEIYHLAAQSFVQDSFHDEFTTMTINSEGTHNLLSIALRVVPNCHFYFAASSEMFGDVVESPQRETTRFNPRSVYGISKCNGFYLTKHYRQAYNFHASSGILFNHESPRRGAEFVTKKITNTANLIKAGYSRELHLGNIEAKRDWGHSKDYVEAMWLMLQQEVPDDYVVATGETHTVKEFCEEAFKYLGLDYREYLVIDPLYMRPTDVEVLCGDATKARELLKWEPKYTFNQLVCEMVEEGKIS